MDGAAILAGKGGRLGFVAGLIAQDKLVGFERLLFRATRGNMFLRRSAVGAVKDPASGEAVETMVFVVFFAGDRARQKVLKVRFFCCGLCCVCVLGFVFWGLGFWMGVCSVRLCVCCLPSRTTHTRRTRAHKTHKTNTIPLGPTSAH